MASRRCDWIDADGVRCPSAGSISRCTRGKGRQYCAGHADCHDRETGREVIDRQAVDGQAKRLSSTERKKVAARLAGPGDAFDFDAVIKAKRRSDAGRAARIYRQAYDLAESAGDDPDACHAAAVAAVYARASRRRLNLPDVPLTPADLRSGAGLE